MANRLRIEQNGEFFVVHFLDSRITDDLTAADIADELYALVGRPDCSKLILNLSNVQFLGSAMLGKLISARAMMAKKSGVLRLCEVQPTIREVLRCGLRPVFDIRNTQAEALEP